MAGLVGNAERTTLSQAGAALNEVVWTEPALAHLEAIRAYIAQFNPRAAREVAASLKASGDSLCNFPHRGRRVRGTAMRELVSRHPYIIRYYIDGDRVVILRVRHTSRRPTRAGRAAHVKVHAKDGSFGAILPIWVTWSYFRSDGGMNCHFIACNHGVQPEMDVISPPRPAYCTQQTVGLTRGMALRAIHAITADRIRETQGSNRIGAAPRYCVQYATVQFYAIGPSAPASRHAAISSGHWLSRRVYC